MKGKKEINGKMSARIEEGLTVKFTFRPKI